VIVRGLPLPLSVIVIVPVLVPRAVGVKVTLMVQLAPAATLVPFLQVVPAAGAKSPLGSTLVMVKVVPLPLFNVSVCAGLVVPTNWSAKIRIVLDREMPGAKPIPVRVITGTLPRASLVMATPPVLKPVAVGLKVTLTVQLAPAVTLLPQLLVWAKSPLAAMLAMFNTAVPLLVSMDVWDRLVVPMSRVPKMRLLLDRVMTGARIPLPVRGTDCGLSGALSVIVMDPSRRPTALGVKAMLILNIIPVSTVAVQKSVPFGSRLIANRVPRRFGTLYVRMGVPLVLNLKTAFVSATKTVPSGRMRKA